MRGWTFAALSCAGLFVLQGCATTVTVSDGTSPTPPPTPAPVIATIQLDFTLPNFPVDAIANMSADATSKTSATRAMQTSIATMIGNGVTQTDVNITYFCAGNTSHTTAANPDNACDGYDLLGDLVRRLEAPSSTSQDESLVPDFDGRALPRQLSGTMTVTVDAIVEKTMTPTEQAALNSTVQTAAATTTTQNTLVESFANSVSSYAFSNSDLERTSSNF